MKNNKLDFGTRKFRDMETGEDILVPVLYQDGTDRNFEKIWLAHILTSLNELGNKKIMILSYLFKNRIVSHNIVPKTLLDISKETGISYPTVSETIQILEKHGLIKRKTGMIYLDPGMIFKGTHNNRMHIMFEFRNIKSAIKREKPEALQPKQLTAAPDNVEVKKPKVKKPTKNAKIKAKAPEDKNAIQNEHDNGKRENLG
jgi:DNA-binding Lrp family transcriptional regulator